MDIVKIDREEFEPQVLRGMEETIKSNPGTQIVMGFTPSVCPNASEFSKYLVSRFKISRIEGSSRLEPTSVQELQGMTFHKHHVDLHPKLL